MCNIVYCVIGNDCIMCTQEGLDFGELSEEQKEQQEALEKSYEPLTKWLQEEALKDMVGTKRADCCF